jgi:pimeloyl-ACP methyl ester carboxylesterase
MDKRESDKPLDKFTFLTNFLQLLKPNAGNCVISSNMSNDRRCIFRLIRNEFSIINQYEKHEGVMIKRFLSRTYRIVAVLVCLVIVASLPARGQIGPQIERDPTQLNNNFERFYARDKLNRKITFYLSIKDKSQAALPLIVFIRGSGCGSIFTKCGEKICGGYQNPLFQRAAGRARVMVVEKPGVEYLDAHQGGGAEGCRREFLEEHTLDRWAAAVGAAIKAAHTLAEIDTTKTLVAGHSEGGIVAARVAAENPRISHVASLSGGGPTQLFDFVEFARIKNAAPDTAKAAISTEPPIYDTWKNIQADPYSTSKFFAGHPYRRWSTFFSSSVLQELLRSKARVYIAHGDKDGSVPVASFDVLRAELTAGGRDVTAERLDGADHGLNRAGESGITGMNAVMANVLKWFFGPPGSLRPLLHGRSGESSRHFTGGHCSVEVV